MASDKTKWARGWLVLVPSVVSATSGLAVALGASNWVGAFAAVGGVVSAVAAYLGVEKDAAAHEVAGKLLTRLRHEARGLRDTHSPSLSAEEFEARVLALEQTYAAYVASLPLTDDKAFDKARARIAAGTFRYDTEKSPDPRAEPPSE